jgi:hypothetical protein
MSMQEPLRRPTELRIDFKGLDGGRTRTRTLDPLIKSQLLMRNRFRIPHHVGDHLMIIAAQSSQQDYQTEDWTSAAIGASLCGRRSGC